MRSLPDVTRVDTGLFDDARDWAFLGDRQLLLLDPAGFEEAVARMAPSRVPEQLARTRELLTLPSPEIKAMAQRDPLGWFELSRASLQGASGLLRIAPGRNEGYVTADGRGQIRSIRIAPDAVRQGDVEMLEDLVLAAVAGAQQRAAELYQTEVRKLASGLPFPFQLPL